MDPIGKSVSSLGCLLSPGGGRLHPVHSERVFCMGRAAKASETAALLIPANWRSFSREFSAVAGAIAPQASRIRGGAIDSRGEGRRNSLASPSVSPAPSPRKRVPHPTDQHAASKRAEIPLRDVCDGRCEARLWTSETSFLSRGPDANPVPCSCGAQEARG